MFPLAPIVLFGKLLIPEELWVHTFGAHISLTLGLLDAICMGLVRIVVGASVLGLLCDENKPLLVA